MEKKKRELRGIKAFCELAGLRLGECRCSENPDWLTELDQGGATTKVGIEVTELSSRGERVTGDRGLLAAWRRVEKSLSDIAKTRPELQAIYGRVSLVDGRPPPKKKCAGLANEVAAFATAQNLRSDDDLVFGNPFGAAYPLMDQFVRRLGLWNVGYSKWYCPDLAVGWVFLALPLLEGAIRGKTARDYRADGLEELWLLVVCGAEAGDVLDGSGPDMDGEVGEILKRIDVTAGPFHRVFLFDMSWNWAYEVWPRVQRLAGAHKPPGAWSDAHTRRVG